MKIRSDSRPLYQRAEEAVTNLLKSCTPGDKLPPEPELAQSLGISRATLREALRNLEQRGIITRRQGRGTYYDGARVLIDNGLETLVSVDTLALRQGLSCSTAQLEITAEAASPDYAVPLHLEPGQPVTVVRRARVAEGHPIAYMVDILPLSVASPEALRDGFAGSVLDFLIARREPAVSYARASIVPLKATKALADRLSVPRGSVLLLLEETVFTRDNVPIDYSQNYFVPQYFQFHLLRCILY